MAPDVGIGERQGYATQLAGLWHDLSRTLRRLDEIAGTPAAEQAEEAAAELDRLRYALHLAGERVFGLVPPPGAEAAHTELAEALAGARDATAEIAEAVEEGGWEATRPLVHEWRGALFRVRLARMRLAPSPHTAPTEPRREGEIVAPLAALGLTCSGAAAFVLGATEASWPLWLAGMVAVAAGLLVYRP